MRRLVRPGDGDVEVRRLLRAERGQLDVELREVRAKICTLELHAGDGEGEYAQG